MANGQRTSRYSVRVSGTLILSVFCAAHFLFGAKAAPVISETEAMRYLSRFGYLPPDDPKSQANVSKEAFSKAISEYQSFVGLNVTGNFDAETAHMMTLPRCGVEDKFEYSAGGRSKRYAFLGFPWPKKDLTYSITKYTPTLSRADVDKTIARAMAVWSEYTDLTFTPMSGLVDIEIRFEIGDHGDGHPLDGPGNVLAHTFPPGSYLAGDVHFDDSEVWTINSYEGKNLFQVAAHEFGHSLGLGHSNVRTALMEAQYRGYQPYFALDNDDIRAIQRLYGPKTIFKDSGAQNLPDICKDPQIDTIFDTADGYVYVFKGEYYWRLTPNGIASGYPKLIATAWKGLPSNIDAAFTHSGRTYFFKGSEYWVYSNVQMDSHYPRKIRSDFPGIPDDIGAATVWNGDGHIYFYKGSRIWRFNPVRERLFRTTFPEPIFSWPGLPENLEAAFSHNGNTYFFKGGAYYRFTDSMYSMDPMTSYETGSTWFGCSLESNNAILSNWLYDPSFYKK